MPEIGKSAAEVRFMLRSRGAHLPGRSGRPSLPTGGWPTVHWELNRWHANEDTTAHGRQSHRSPLLKYTSNACARGKGLIKDKLQCKAAVKRPVRKQRTQWWI